MITAVSTCPVKVQEESPSAKAGVVGSAGLARSPMQQRMEPRPASRRPFKASVACVGTGCVGCLGGLVMAQFPPYVLPGLFLICGSTCVTCSACGCAYAFFPRREG
jgi:hypothetical protein